MQQVDNIYFTKFFIMKLLKVLCTFQYNHQATGLKKYEITTINLKTTNPYLPDQVELKHQFVKFEAGHAIHIKKENVFGKPTFHSEMMQSRSR